MIRCNKYILYQLFLGEFQPMLSAPDNDFLSSDQDTNRFMM